MPELVVTLQAALRGSSGIAFGIVIGSNIANLLLIFGLAVAITPVLVTRRAAARDGGVLIGATALLVVFTSFGTLVVWQGALMAGPARPLHLRLLLARAAAGGGEEHPASAGGDMAFVAEADSGSPRSPRCSGWPR